MVRRVCWVIALPSMRQRLLHIVQASRGGGRSKCDMLQPRGWGNTCVPALSGKRGQTHRISSISMFGRLFSALVLETAIGEGEPAVCECVCVCVQYRAARRDAVLVLCGSGKRHVVGEQWPPTVAQLWVNVVGICRRLCAPTFAAPLYNSFVLFIARSVSSISHVLAVSA